VGLEQGTGLKNAQMLGHSRDGDTERPGKVRHGHWTGTQKTNDPTARRITKGIQDSIDPADAQGNGRGH
jgi:hypothetical protein